MTTYSIPGRPLAVNYLRNKKKLIFIDFFHFNKMKYYLSYHSINIPYDLLHFGHGEQLLCDVGSSQHSRPFVPHVLQQLLSESGHPEPSTSQTSSWAWVQTKINSSRKITECPFVLILRRKVN